MRRARVTALAGIFLMNLRISPVCGAPEAAQPASLKTQSQPPAATPEKPGQNVEKLLATLNETLTENRNLREEMTSLQDAIQKISLENNILRSQISKMQRQVDQNAAEKEKTGTELEQQVGGLKKTAEKLEKEKKEFQDSKTAAEEKLKTMEDENAKLHRLLDTSILESEKTEYLRLIHESQGASEHAVEEMSKAKLESEQARSELASLYFLLGNMLFEAKNYEKAIAQYQRALALNPGNSWAHHNLGVIYDFYLNDHKSALSHYEKYLQLKPIQEEAHKIRERIIDLQMLKELTPRDPLKNDFLEYHKRS